MNAELAKTDYTVRAGLVASGTSDGLKLNLRILAYRAICGLQKPETSGASSGWPPAHSGLSETCCSRKNQHRSHLEACSWRLALFKQGLIWVYWKLEKVY